MAVYTEGAIGAAATTDRSERSEAGPDRLGPRLVSLDAFRGLTIAAMILVNNPGSWANVYAPLLHADWHGWTPTDLIFPFFLFIVGVAVPFSFAKRLARGDSRAELWRHVGVRSALIVAIGLFLSGFPTFDLSTIRIPGVLQRIGVVYLLAASAYLFAGATARVAVTALCLFGYWALMALVPVPGSTAGDLSPDGNLAAYLDRLLMDGHLWSQSRTWDPEGLLSTLPAVATTLLGIFTGEWLRSERPRLLKVYGLVGAGSLAVVVGSLWDVAFPINKNLWTSSYVIFTAGAGLLTLGLCYWLVDVRGRRRWAWPFVVYGRNALAVFVASGLLAKMLVRTQVGRPDGSVVSLYTWIYESVFLPWASPVNASLAFAVATVALWWLALFALDRKKIYIKV